MYFSCNFAPIVLPNITFKIVQVGEASIALRLMPKQPYEVTAEQLAQMHRLVEIIRHGKYHHVFPPMQMDSTNSGLVTKGHCVTQQFRIESVDWTLTAAKMDLVLSATGDRGVESGLNQTYLPDLDTFDYWRPARIDDDEFALLMGEVPRDPVISLERALDISGFEHAVHLIEGRLLLELKSYQEFKKNFESLCITFHRAYTRKRFTRRVPDLQKHLFKTGPPILEGGRTWTVVTRAVQWFKGCGREDIIRAYWHHESMCGNAEIDEDMEVDGDGVREQYFKDTAVHVTRCTELIPVPFFWASLGLVEVFSGWLAHIVNWALGCVCHPHALREAFGLRISDIECPQRMCKAPEVVAGEMDDLMEACAEDSYQEVSGISDPLLSAPDRGRLLDEFFLCRQVVFSQYEIRTYGWHQSPLKGLILGYSQDEVIIRKLLEMLAEFEAIPVVNYSTLHVFTLDLLARGGPLREQVLCLVTRTRRIHELPGLKRIRLQHPSLPSLPLVWCVTCLFGQCVGDGLDISW